LKPVRCLRRDPAVLLAPEDQNGNAYLPVFALNLVGEPLIGLSDLPVERVLPLRSKPRVHIWSERFVSHLTVERAAKVRDDHGAVHRCGDLLEDVDVVPDELKEGSAPRPECDGVE
jgi:hypothetical protein